MNETDPQPVDALEPDQADDASVGISIDQTAVGDDLNQVNIPSQLPLLPIREAVVFPGTLMPLQINREKSKRVLDLALAGSRMIGCVLQRRAEVEDPKLEDLHRIGTACAILKMYKLSDGTETIIVHGLRRIGVESATTEPGYLLATVHPYSEPIEITTEQKALMHTVRFAADRIIQLSPNIPDEARALLQSIQRPGVLADFLAANLSISHAYRQELLETLDVTERLRKINLTVAAQLEVVELSNKIQEQVHSQVDKSQREYYLREQLKAIQQELGEGQTSSAKLVTLRDRIKDARMPEPVEKEAYRELERLEAIPAVSPEYSMTMDYLDWLIELPWSVSTEDSLDIDRARQILDEDHYGLDKVKRRIVEFLAVRKLNKEGRGPILCFAGPPGVGKTSLGQSIARAMGRKFIRISLGGIRDEAAIRGHRRTYIGSMPGRIIRELRRAGSNNPLFMLDEVDKIGQDFQGDPMSALLEVLDPAQNSTFTDHYLGLPFDLSKVLFIGTANYMAAIEPALRDRMEIIEISGYTHREKLAIAKRYLLPRQLRENGLTAEQVQFDDEIVMTIITEYTREAGVRTLERKIGAICRARAAVIARGQQPDPRIRVDDLRTILGPKEFESEVAASVPIPGVVTGLAFTPTGGEILFIEATKMPGSGKLSLTGQLGDVMRESAHAAVSIIRSRTGAWGVRPDAFSKLDLHVHVPAGATPKDGPSAGVALLVAMTSVLLNRSVDPAIGLTGEITLSGRVLPVGGIREKVIAGHRAGLKTIILPARNEPHLEEIPIEVREQLNFVLVGTIDDALNYVFGVEKDKAVAAAEPVARDGQAPSPASPKRRPRPGRRPGRKSTSLRSVRKRTRSARSAGRRK